VLHKTLQHSRIIIGIIIIDETPTK